MRRVAIMCAVLGLAMAAFAADPGKGVENSGPAAGVEAIGGPDGFGYSYIDSTETTGFEPTYSFVDITATGTAMNLTDDGEGNATMGFSFPFYGGSYTDVRIGNNGGLFLGTATGDFFAGNVCPMPSTSGSDAPRINVFWDDIDSDTGNVYYETQGSCAHPDCAGACFIVEWFDRPHFSNTGSCTFEVILCDSGDILFQYADLDFGDPTWNYGASATVGIEDELQDATYFLEYSCDTADLADSFAIRWTTGPVIPVELQRFTVE